VTPDVLSARVDVIISNAERALAKQAVKTQGLMFDQMSLLLNKLALDSEGLIIQNQANRNILAQAGQYFNNSMGEYNDSINTLPNTLGNINSQNALYFDAVVDSFKPNSLYITSIRNQTIVQIESLLLNEGIELTLKQPIISILNQNINTGAAYSDLVKQLRTFILGNNEVEGTLLRYSKQIVTDTLFNYNRALQEAVSVNSGLIWIKYTGVVTLKKLPKKSPAYSDPGKKLVTTRDFCLSRIGKYYHKKEVEKWATLTWDGKRAGTTSSTIFIYAGGYNCRHQLIYVHESTVPKINLDRVN